MAFGCKTARIESPISFGGGLSTVFRVKSARSEEHTSELQSHSDLVCRLLLEKKKRARWTLRLLENKVVELGIVDRASDSTIGRALKKTIFRPIAANTGTILPQPNGRSQQLLE